MRGGNDSEHNLIPNVVAINLNVLRMLMKGGIVLDEDNGLIIAIHGHWWVRRNAEILEK